MDLKKLFSLEGKIAFVSGGSAGIGAMIVEGLLTAGVRVYTCGRNKDRLDQMASHLARHGDLRTIVAAVGTDEGIDLIKQEISTHENRLDILVNNVGATHKAPLGHFSRTEFERVCNINMATPFATVQALLPFLKAAGRPDDPARVINIGSIGARKIMPLDNFAYSASKAGLDTLTRHLGAALVKDNINVNCIPCGVFRTELSAYLFDPQDPRSKNRPSVPMDRPGEPEDIVGGVIYLSSRASNYVTGIRLPIAGGQSTVDWEQPREP